MSKNRFMYDLLGVLSPAASAVAEPKSTNPHLGVSLIPGATGAVAGFLLWPQHRVLGVLAGDALGLNAYRLYRNAPGDRTTALTNMGVAATAIAGSLAWKAHPFWGWFAGFLVGAAATSFVDGSNSNTLVKNWRR